MWGDPKTYGAKLDYTNTVKNVLMAQKPYH